MASQAPVTGNSVTEVQSFVRGLHAYLELWEPVVGDILTLRREPTNDKDRLAVAVVKNDAAVGHMPYTLAPLISYFLMRAVNKGVVEITGERVNHGAGMGLEVPCIYRLYGPKTYIDKLEKLLGDNTASQHLRAKTVGQC